MSSFEANNDTVITYIYSGCDIILNLNRSSLESIYVTKMK